MAEDAIKTHFEGVPMLAELLQQASSFLVYTFYQGTKYYKIFSLKGEK